MFAPLGRSSLGHAAGGRCGDVLLLEVWGLGCRVEGFGFRVWVYGLWLRAKDLGFRVQLLLLMDKILHGSAMVPNFPGSRCKES